MTDIVSSAKRSLMMAGIKGKNTRPELIIRKALFKRGFRYRIHTSLLLGKPDIFLPKYKATIFIHGCFWHGHKCPLFKLPSSRTDFWQNKIFGNKENDTKACTMLIEKGYKVLVVWECAIKGKGKLSLENIISDICIWLQTSENYLEIKGTV